jgi:hypothetical protein
VVSSEARNGVISFTRKSINPFFCTHTETDRSDPPPRFRCPPLVLPPRHGCGRRPEANEFTCFACADTGWCRVRQETGSFYTEIKQPLLLHTHRNGPFRPTTAIQMSSVGAAASPWMWTKARSERGALIRLCGDGVVSNEARNGVILHGNQSTPSSAHTQKRTIPTRHRTPDGLSWCSHLAMDVGEGQKQTRCIDSPVRRRGDVE